MVLMNESKTNSKLWPLHSEGKLSEIELFYTHLLQFLFKICRNIPHMALT